MQTDIIEGFELSPQQQRLWLLPQNNFADRAGLAILIEGNLNVEVLKEALYKLIDRHEILRTTFHSVPHQKFPIQSISDRTSIQWQEMDLRRLSFERQQAKIEELFQEKGQYSFNLEQGPLVCCTLLTLSAQKYTLLLTLPALCADPRTLRNIVEEISSLYARSGQNELPIQYMQFSAWQNEILEEEYTETGTGYWQEKKIYDFLNLKLLFEAQPVKKLEFKPQFLAQTLCPETMAKIKEFVQEHKISTSVFFLACWQILLWRLTGQPNIVIGTICDGRSYEGLEQALGLFAKYLPVHCHLEDDDLFIKVLSQVDESIREAYLGQEYFAWEQIVGESENFNAQSLSLFCFDFEEQRASYSAGEILFTIYKQYTCIDRFKVKLSCINTEGILSTEFYYDSSLFSAETIERLAGQFQTLLNSVVSNSNTSISELQILSAVEQQLVVEWNHTKVDYSQDKCIHQLFEAQVEQTPDTIAVVFEDKQLTYQDLNVRTNQLAHYLQVLGVGPEVMVGLFVERSLDIVIGLLGILKAGAAYLPLDPALPTDALAFRLQDCQVPILLTQQLLVAKLPENAAQIICLDADWELIPQENQENPQNSVQPENLVYGIFTSGSTGKPKAVAVEHKQLVNYLYGILDRLNLPTGASFATVSTFAADLGNTVIFPALCTGGCLHILSQERASDPQALFDYFQRHPIDYLKIVPSHFAAFLASSPPQSILPRQCLVLGGEASSWDLINIIQRQTPNCQILNHYGPTETTVGVLTYPVNNGQASHNSQTLPLGKPLTNTQVYVLDSHLQPVPIGVPGELHIGGLGVARGYINRPELTTEKFIPNPFSNEPTARLYKTGDLVCYLSDGNIEYLGRIDHQVKIRGFRVELGEIEAVLSQHPGVGQVVVLAQEDKTSRQRLVAYIVPDRQGDITTSDLRCFLSEKLPEYMIPSAFLLLKSLPLTTNGKVDRQALLSFNLNDSELNANFLAPRTAAENVVADIWKQVLGVHQIGIHDNFFELGGHSLLATQVFLKLHKIFQVKLSLRHLFETPTVEGIVNVIEQNRGGGEVVEKIAETLIEVKKLSLQVKKTLAKEKT